jgi:low affinity Fe/Cu permease
MATAGGITSTGTGGSVTGKLHPSSNVTDDDEHEACMSRRVTIFRHVAHYTSHAVGTSTAFCIAVGTILVWGALGPVFHFSDTWQLVINTGTTIVTFLMIFLVQNTQNRESESVSLKLDELIRAVDAARNEMLAIDDLDDAQLAALRVEFRKLGEKRPVRS